MDRSSVSWRGYIPAVTTPFTASGELDRRGWQELVEWFVAEGLHGIAVGGPTGEWFSMAAAERVELFRLAARQVRGRMPVLGGCSAYTPREAIDYARAAKECGLDGIFLTPPPYVVPTDREIVAFFQAVSDAVAIPICVYNWPRGTNVDLTARTVQRLAEIEHVVAVKNSTGDVGRRLEIFFAVKDRLRYFGVPVNELGITLIQHHGADGSIGSGAVLGAEHPRFFECVWKGDLDGARESAARNRFLFEQWTNPDFSSKIGSPQAVMKAALNLRGLPGGHPRPPILPLLPEEVDRVRETLHALGITTKD